jgi:hypothetical protein
MFPEYATKIERGSARESAMMEKSDDAAGTKNW